MIAGFMIACDNTDIPVHHAKDGQSLTNRTEDCTDCPMNDCCCMMEYQSGAGDLFIEFCGSTGLRLSTEVCELDNPPSPCDPIEGYYLGPVPLNGTITRQLFCMDENSSLVINVTGSGSVTVSITCQVDETSPQTINVTLTAGNRYFFNADGSCEIEQCI